MGNWDLSRIPSLAGKVAVVTGSNSGIGFSTALELTRKGAHVVLACRNVERAQAAVRAVKAELEPDPVTLEFLLLDLSDLAAAHPTHTPDGLEMQFAVNHLGHFYLTHLLFDLLKSGNEVSRIVNVSSLSHRWVKMNLRTLARSKTNKKLYAKEYGTSKLANMLFTSPGITSSDIAPKLLATYLPSWLLGFIVKLTDMLHIMQATERGALPSLFAATDASVISGDFFGPDGFLEIRGKGSAKAKASAASHSKHDGAALWAMSEDLTNCTFNVTPLNNRRQ
ncbi:short chain dehydrogenase [Phytophthora infestans]|uniref:Short chain dehydrogenase n=1 Tax=Phytophthora infestans TaxID=4787 RepID=A0A8S9UU17_PHYIN|nr:short chain dehydrogenase [Phytophthora infestans]